MLLLTKYTVLYKENEICCIILLSLPSRERGLKYICSRCRCDRSSVAPFAGAWIEIINTYFRAAKVFVAPFAGAWIEIYFTVDLLILRRVAPFAGAWIEILLFGGKLFVAVVAPFAGAWIEIKKG